MSDIENKDDLKEFFKTGAIPTEDQFASLIESYVHKYDQRIGIDQADPKNNLDVNGNVSIGSDFSGINTAPADGLIVQEEVGIGTHNPGEKLHVAGNVKIDGTLILNNQTIIDSDGKWQGDPTGLKGDQGEKGDKGDQGEKGDDGERGPQGHAGSSAWSDGNNKVTTADRVGIGTQSPNTQLHVDGYVTSDQVGFTLSGFQNINQNNERIEFTEVHTNYNNGWNDSNLEFVAPVNGVYHFSAFIVAWVGKSQAIALEEVRMVKTHNHQTSSIPVFDKNWATHIGQASVVWELNAGDTVTLEAQAPDNTLINHANFSGHRL